MSLIRSSQRRALHIAHALARVWWWFRRPSVSGVYVIIARHAGTENEAWLFIRNSYRRGLSVPGGGIRRGETPLEAAVRETAEEVALHYGPESIRAIDEFEIEYMYRRDHVHFFRVDLDEGSGQEEPQADGVEVVSASFRRLQDVEADELVFPVRVFLGRGTVS